MDSSTIPAVFYRGGTSNALMIQRADLPTSQNEWQPILAGAIGSPDPYGRQLNGMGGGVSSLSKVCVISKSERSDADVDYTFIQMGIKDGTMDLVGTCGNMASAVGPYAVDEGIVDPVTEQEEDGSKFTVVKIFNTNTSKIIHSKFSVEGTRPFFKSSGDFSIDGVPGTGSRITLSFLSPGGSKTGRIFPTGNPVDTMDICQGTTDSRGLSSLRASLVDAANPAVIIVAEDIGIRGDIQPSDLDNDKESMELLEAIRKKGASMMGMDPSVDSVPKMVLVSSPTPTCGDVDIVARVLSMRQAHKAIPLTIALNLGVASQLEGTLPHLLAKRRFSDGRVVVGHPSGKIEVGAQVRNGSVESAVLHRTARPLMRGQVYWR